jgi:acetylornithine deacetylase/succinyl-diaminopimelate desuccinylase-like protein
LPCGQLASGLVQDLTLSRYLDEQNKDRVVAALADWARIPSVSAQPAHAADVQASARFCADLLAEAGLSSVEILDAGGSPAVYAEGRAADAGAPTVLLYGHHDVQPTDPEELWESPPFEPSVEGGVLRARGASDDKGQVLMQVEAVRGLVAELGGLPTNVKFLIEGEEEVGSTHFEELLKREREHFSADVVVVSDSTMLAPGTPSTTVGMRGLVAFDIELRTARGDLHSGIWGGTVPNAADLAARVAAALHDADRRVTVPGFYDKVRELPPAEAAMLGALPSDEADICAKAGVAYLEGEKGRSPRERTGTRPTAEVVGIHSGYGGEGMKTIVPATANLKVALRLVPDQRPDEVAEAFQRWVRDLVPDGALASLTQVGGVAPMLTPLDHPALAALATAIERAWGQRPLFERSGGSGPEEALARVLGAPVIFLGIGLPDDNYHAPNERLVLDQLWRGILAAGELLVGLGALGAAGLK